MDIQHEHTKIHLNKLQQISISVFWLGYQLFFSAMTLLILPIEIGRMAPNSYRGFALGICM